MPVDTVPEVVRQVARESHGRLLAYLSVQTRDVARAEDALSEAFLAALRTWSRDGIPESPAAWLLTTARRQLRDASRGETRQRAHLEALSHMLSTVPEREIDELPDERLRLMLACAHEALAPDVHAPLMLQAVLGLDAETIARAYLVSPATMSQRLVRAKLRLRTAGISFDFPEPERLSQRLSSVLDAIYTAFSSGWDAGLETNHRLGGLADEAVWLARLVVRLLPDEPEPLGLLAMLLFAQARKPARRDASGRFVPLLDQDVRLWDAGLIEEADRLLAFAATLGRPARFQLEAAIQSCHSDRRRTGEVPWPHLVGLYDGLIALAPSLGALVGRAAAIGQWRGAGPALEALDRLDTSVRDQYQPYWSTRAHFLAELGDHAAAVAAYRRAQALTEDPSVRVFLQERAAAIDSP
jgi:RNA polymerase sigma-70 factor, ECF subfamily